ncbi:hypothetical protein CK203_077563 [Vitis vinifera]|uniref:Uncharacterized protein n=1 Tax=Vitis vinifera TaxID=29760 RepID=A0A438DT61_VITVI|nr:hypothetical protein CK203_077563 [Vitis vinifera]
MCRGDNHLAWKHLVSLEVNLDPIKISFLHVGAFGTFRATLVIVGFDYPLCSLILSDQRSDQRDMDSQIVIVDQFAAAMASIQEALASLGQRIDGQQAQ